MLRYLTISKAFSFLQSCFFVLDCLCTARLCDFSASLFYTMTNLLMLSIITVLHSGQMIALETQLTQIWMEPCLTTELVGILQTGIRLTWTFFHSSPLKSMIIGFLLNCNLILLCSPCNKIETGFLNSCVD